MVPEADQVLSTCPVASDRHNWEVNSFSIACFDLSERDASLHFISPCSLFFAPASISIGEISDAKLRHCSRRRVSLRQYLLESTVERVRVISTVIASSDVETTT